MYLAVTGPNTCWPISGQSKKQGATSGSTTEAEIVAANHGIKSVGIPAIELLSILVGRSCDHAHMSIKEDNEAMIRICHTGKHY